MRYPIRDGSEKHQTAIGKNPENIIPLVHDSETLFCSGILDACELDNLPSLDPFYKHATK